MRENPQIVIQVTGGGSGTGIAALINGATDICQASRRMKPREKEQILKRYQQGVTEIPVALDGVTVYINEKNPVQELSIDQIKSIYICCGRVKNWKYFGGEDRQIIPYSRENNSGTYIFFKENVLGGKDFTPYAQTLPGTAAVVNAVAKDPGSIGFGGIGYSKGVRALRVKRDKDSIGIAPSLDSIREGTYPLSRELYFYLVGPPKGQIKRFIDWVLSEQGQRVVKDVGFYPIRR
jgi:phosphate transport system substrate-binding protein